MMRGASLRRTLSSQRSPSFAGSPSQMALCARRSLLYVREQQHSLDPVLLGSRSLFACGRRLSIERSTSSRSQQLCSSLATPKMGTEC